MLAWSAQARPADGDVRLRCAGANGLWLLSSAPPAIAFRSGLSRVAEVQEQLLLRTLRRNASTPFGREHGFSSIRSVRDYQERVTIRTWDQVGEDPARGIAEPVERYETTSGSAGPAKRIPYTRSLRHEMHAAIAPWIVSLFQQQPRAFAGEAYWSVSPGGESDEEVLGFLQRRLVRAVQAVPSSVRFANDVESFRRQTLAHLLRCRTLSLISVWHPSFLELLIGDTDTVAAWPELRVISCWADASSSSAAAALARRFPHAAIQPKGLLSTEGFVSIPFDGALTLAYRSHFFEFVEVDDAAVHTATGLRKGARYRVVLTTGGGLYRYDTGDLVEVMGTRESCPLLRFVGRVSQVSDHFGEKLHEIFVRERLEVVLRDCPHAFAMLACDGNAYVLYIETGAAGGEILAAANELEHRLREAFHYDYARRLGQLAPLRAFRVTSGAATYLSARSPGRVLSAIKIPTLDPGTGWSDRFAGRMVD